MDAPRNLSIAQWWLRLLAWDGLLPVSIWSAPLLVAWLLPNNDRAIEITAVTLPIAAFFVRYYVGKRYISSNNCGPMLRWIQTVVFCFAIFLLVLIDSLMILLQEFAKGPVLDAEALAVMAVPYSIYLTTMAFALYPGSREVSASDDQAADQFELGETFRYNEYGGEEYR